MTQAAAPPSCSTLAGAELPQAKKKKMPCLYAHRVTLIMSNSLGPFGLWPAGVLRQGGSPGKNTGVYWPILVAIPFWSTVFPAALTANSSEYLVLPEPLRPKQWATSTPGPQQGQTQVLHSGANPRGPTQRQRWR